MALKFEAAYKKVATFAGSPCEIDVADEALWGLQGGILQAVVFHWPSLPQLERERVFHKLWGDKIAPYLRKVDGLLELANDDIVPFAVLGRPGLHETGVTLEEVIEAKLEGVLFFDLQRGNPSSCPVLLWDFKRFGKVADDQSLKLRLASMGGTVSGVVLQIPLRVFTKTVDHQTSYWEIEVKGRTVRMGRGQVAASGQKDWGTHEDRLGDFPSSFEAKVKAEQLIARYLADGYVERGGFDQIDR